jgi:hypothetical protein
MYFSLVMKLARFCILRTPDSLPQNGHPIYPGTEYDQGVRDYRREREGVWWFSVEPGEIGLTALEEAGDGLNQYAKDCLPQLTAGLAQR